jgi:methionyl-tRNA synthetase
MKEIPGRIADSLNHFRFREGLANMMNLARLGNKYLTESEPWKVFDSDPNRVGTVLNISLQICAQLSIVAQPFLPFTAEKIRKMIGIRAYSWNEATLLTWLPVGHSLKKSRLLFEKIDDQAVDAQIRKLHGTKQPGMDNETPPATAEPSSQPALSAPLPEISYEDFTRLDIRAATILEAEPVPKTDKLLKLKVDTGFDQRTVVSGIAQYFKPEDLIGRRITILANLAPRTLRGIESKGMVLLAENPDGTLCFISPDEGTVNGATVK